MNRVPFCRERAEKRVRQDPAAGVAGGPV